MAPSQDEVTDIINRWAKLGKEERRAVIEHEDFTSSLQGIPRAAFKRMLEIIDSADFEPETKKPKLESSGSSSGPAATLPEHCTIAEIEALARDHSHVAVTTGKVQKFHITIHKKLAMWNTKQLCFNIIRLFEDCKIAFEARQGYEQGVGGSTGPREQHLRRIVRQVLQANVEEDWVKVIKFRAALSISEEIDAACVNAMYPKDAKGQIMDLLTSFTFKTPEDADNASDAEIKKRREKIERARHLGDKVKLYIERFGKGIVLLLALVMGPTSMMDLRVWQVHAQLLALERFPERDAVKAICEYVEPIMNQALDQHEIDGLPDDWRETLRSKATTELIMYGPKDIVGQGDVKQEEAGY